MLDSPLSHDEFRGLIQGTSGTAHLAFSSHIQPDVFSLKLYTTKLRATANLFEGRLTVDHVRSLPRPLIPLANGLREARAVRKAAISSLFRKLSGGPGAYEGLWELLTRIYLALDKKLPPPVLPGQIMEVNALLNALVQGSIVAPIVAARETRLIPVASEV
jgi:hypothetical protein